MTHVKKTEMRSILLILILLISIIPTVRGQNNGLIITHNQNELWIDSLLKSDLDIQTKMIRQRLIQDTAVYCPCMTVPSGILRDKTIHIPQNYVDGLKIADLTVDTFKINGFKGDGRLLFGIRLKDKSNKNDLLFIKRDSTTTISTIKELATIISFDNITGIEIIRHRDEKFALFGGSFGFGVIIIDLKNKKDYQKVKRLNKTRRHN